MAFRHGSFVEAIWLKSVGDTIQVHIERDGEWQCVIHEKAYSADGKLSPISHIVEARGLAPQQFRTTQSDNQS